MDRFFQTFWVGFHEEAVMAKLISNGTSPLKQFGGTNELFLGTFILWYRARGIFARFVCTIFFTVLVFYASSVLVKMWDDQLTICLSKIFISPLRHSAHVIALFPREFHGKATNDHVYNSVTTIKCSRTQLTSTAMLDDISRYFLEILQPSKFFNGPSRQQ